ncbi:charged multivesicular body protein 6-B isoform X1 [Tribolium castaneum]|uniref:charged multivesicular body protein 6-B isoform X1 n=1 Tax=Tribolium castaneum TaxID=7070 RepID=UPI00046C0460|nr:PREDICTED: charged multivesicular body protein 6-B isoform X1 [Tribolium castaneum]XP_015838516.1 PREDICTED: charged multivesicular body protein 6-B isoform X1 [Tribolium castaneum]XP_015838517.1 PREDICTED: charged multivesicular body protein 6-B isoform X1 [Tribolium castaneum]XP_015838518.1 PREDICTED: charged multivesicular body protein 6-B isoform X1 [Tribolium castaneum]XP_015838519.1 PREDICTED: charged multivesicular body protein 6-B isoform X1 [Tribolium castaneum]|eukprot:XP_008197375.1 PREDICTED: charged multivesicular body protein 6-B isoform X1 [Tribolium castaneum]
MGIIFGKKKPVSRITQQDKAVLQLKQQRDKLKQYQKRIELSLASDRELAKKLLNKGQKERAKLLLRKKRFQESLLQKTDNQLDNLERLTHDIEFAQVEVEVVNGLKQGNEALKKVNEALNIEDIEKILEETREGVEKQEEINALLSGGLTEEDEAAVEDELAEIIGQSLPNVPEDKPEIISEVPESPIKGKRKLKISNNFLTNLEKKKRREEPVALEA